MCQLSIVRRKRQSVGQRRAPVAEVLTMDPLDDLPRTCHSWPASLGHLPTLAVGGYLAPYLHLARCDLAALSALPRGQSHRMGPTRAAQGRRHAGRWRRAAPSETVVDHSLVVSSACKPLVGSPAGRQVGARSTTSANVPSRPRRTASCSEGFRVLPSPRPRRPPASACRTSPRRVRCRVPHPGPRLPAPSLWRLRPRQAGGLQLQAPLLLL